jgi:hypothetical protein
LLVELKDGNGTVIDPSSGAIYDVQIFAVHRTSFEVIGKWAKRAATGFTTLSVVEEPASGDYKAQCIMNTAQSIQAQQGLYEIQVDLYIPNGLFDPPYELKTQKGILMNLNPATNG